MALQAVATVTTCVRCGIEFTGRPVVYQPLGWEICEPCALAHDIDPSSGLYAPGRARPRRRPAIASWSCVMDLHRHCSIRIGRCTCTCHPRSHD
jgi:hypothetical protein